MTNDLTALKAEIFAACDDVYRPIRSIQARMPGSTAAYSHEFYRALGELRAAGKLQCNESMYRRHPVLDQ